MSEENNGMAPTYKASLSTGVYGSHCMNNVESLPDHKKYTYFPSISNGTFGTWKYNASSPFQISNHTNLTQYICTQNNDKQMKMKSRGYGFFRKKETIDYKFKIQGPRNEAIMDGKRYNVKLLQEYTLQENTATLYICEGSVVSFSGECIVNAANEGMIGGGGVDGAISSAGGDALYDLRYKEPTIQGTKHIRCRTGDAKITQSGYPYNRLKCDYVIHAVGPNYSIMYRAKQMKMEDIDQLLYSSYARSMLLCKEYNIKSVGFCLISSGIFRGPRSLEDVLRIGITAIRDYMFAGIQVYLIGYNHSELLCLARIAPKVLGDITKEYAKVKERKGWGNIWDNDSDDDDDHGFFSFFHSKKKVKGKDNNK